MIPIKSDQEQKKMAVAGSILAAMFNALVDTVQEGISTFEIDQLIAKHLAKEQLVSSTKGFMGYRHASCISVNDEVVHGVPMKSKILRDGDLLKIDVCASWKGYCADMTRCFFIGEVEKEVHQLVHVAEAALEAGIRMARPGNHVTDISHAIEKVIVPHGYGIVREFAGHGIGKKMHEDPEILNYGRPGCGPILKAGMAFALEPMITLGKQSIFIDSDGWTVKTMDGSIAAHVEDTVVVTDTDPWVITR